MMAKTKKGAVIFGKYKIISRLGQGGYSKVFLAEHIKLKCLRAIKIIDKTNPLYDRLYEEALVLKSLSHECIPTIYDIEEDGECAYIIEEYCKGKSLKDEKNNVKEFKNETIVDYVLQICDLMEYLHNGVRKVLYLDLKPDNIIVSEGRLCLVDFGAAVLADCVDNMKYSLGTKGYAAPEQCDKRRPDIRSDIYGIGKVMEYMASDKLDKRLVKIMEKCLKDNPDERFSSVAKLRKEIEGFREDSGIKRKLFSSHKLPGLIHGRRKKNDINRFIGVFSTHPGAGATHISYMLCNCLAKKMEKTLMVSFYNHEDELCVDMPGHHELGDFLAGSDYSFDMLKVNTATELFGYDTSIYRYVVVDAGVVGVRNSILINKMDVRMVATSMSQWKIHELFKFVERYGVGDFTWKYYAPFITDKDQKIMNDYFGVRVNRIGYEPLVDVVSEKAEEILLNGIKGE